MDVGRSSVNYSKLKNNAYIVSQNMPGQKIQQKSVNKLTDDVVPEELEKKKKRTELNESTYYSTRGTNNNPAQGE